MTKEKPAKQFLETAELWSWLCLFERELVLDDMYPTRHYSTLGELLQHALDRTLDKN